jgi:hypothetical protein
MRTRARKGFVFGRTVIGVCIGDVGYAEAVGRGGHGACRTGWCQLLSLRGACFNIRIQDGREEGLGWSRRGWHALGVRYALVKGQRIEEEYGRSLLGR